MKTRTTIVAAMVLVAAMTRVLPHPPNFTPIGAIALFGAAHFERRWLSFAVPLTIMLVSDTVLHVLAAAELFSGWMAGTTGFHAGMWVVYGAVLLITVLGLALRSRRSFWPVVVAVPCSSVVFFGLTNFAWWAGYDLYPHTWEGLLTCYTAALPFFGWALLGDVCYAAALFGSFALAQQRFAALRLDQAGPRLQSA